MKRLTKLKIGKYTTLLISVATIEWLLKPLMDLVLSSWAASLQTNGKVLAYAGVRGIIIALLYVGAISAFLAWNKDIVLQKTIDEAAAKGQTVLHTAISHVAEEPYRVKLEQVASDPARVQAVLKLAKHHTWKTDPNYLWIIKKYSKG